MDILKFITEEIEALGAVLFILGVMLKNIKQINDAYIPFILLVIGLALQVASYGFQPVAFTNAVFAVGSAVLVDQLFKQGKKLGGE